MCTGEGHFTGHGTGFDMTKVVILYYSVYGHIHRIALHSGWGDPGL